MFFSWLIVAPRRRDPFCERRRRETSTEGACYSFGEGLHYVGYFGRLPTDGAKRGSKINPPFSQQKSPPQEQTFACTIRRKRLCQRCSFISSKFVTKIKNILFLNFCLLTAVRFFVGRSLRCTDGKRPEGVPRKRTDQIV